MIWIRFWNDKEQEGPIVGPYVELALVQTLTGLRPPDGTLVCWRIDGKRVDWPYNEGRKFEVLGRWYQNFSIQPNPEEGRSPEEIERTLAP